MGKNDSLSSAKVCTPGTPFTASRYISVVCTAAGNVEFTFENGDLMVVPVTTGYTAFPFAVINITAGGNTTAVATYYRHH
jgi:hypothetical protein